MLKAETARIAALLASGALQSGKLPVEVEQVAKYYSELYNLIAELDQPCGEQFKSGKSREIGRITEEPDEIR